jgi:hypothetical protein
MDINLLVEDGQLELVVVVDVLGSKFNALGASAEKLVPETSLLAVVGAVLPALAVVQVVVLNAQLSVEELEKPSEG